MQRRSFLFSLAAAAAQGAGPYRPKVAVQCYVWTQDFRAKNETIAQGMPRMFADCRAAGFSRIELMSLFFTPDTRAQTEDLLHRHRFELPIVYSGGRLHDDGSTEAIGKILELADIVQPLGCRILNVNPDPKPAAAPKNDAELEMEAQSIERLRQELQKRKLRLVLHNHAPEMKENAREFRYLLSHAKAGVCMDVDWVYQGGQNVLELMKEAGARIGSLHVRNARSGIWTESTDDGEYDYQAVFHQLKAAGFDGYLVVELAWNPKTTQTRSLKENLERSRLWVEKTFQV